MFLRYSLIAFGIIVILLSVLAFRYPLHTTIITTSLYDIVNPPPSMDFAAIGVDRSRIDASDEAKAYIRQKLLEKYPVGTVFSQASDELQDAGISCRVSSASYTPEHFETTLADERRGGVYQCSGEFGRSRITPCYLFFDVQTDTDDLISDYWVNIGCTGP